MLRHTMSRIARLGCTQFQGTHSFADSRRRVRSVRVLGNESADSSENK